MVFDIIFLCIFIWAAYRGYSKGLIIQAATFAALILGIFGAVKFAGFTSELILDNTEYSGEYLHIVSFVLTFIVIVIGVHFISRLLEKLLKAVALGFINRLAGGLFNLIKFSLIISVVLIVLNIINENSSLLPKDKIAESKLYKPLAELAPRIFPYLRFQGSESLIQQGAEQLNNI